MTPVAPGTRQRLAVLARTEGRLARRFHVVTAAVVVTAGWAVVLRLLPTDAREVVVPVVLLTDVTALGFLFVPAILVLERIEGVEAALRVTPVRTGERVGVRVGVTTALSLAAALGVCVAAGVPDVTPRLLGAALTSALFGLVAFAMTAGATTLTSFLTRAPFVAVPLIAPALAHLAGLTHPVLFASPVTSAVDLLRGDPHPSGVVWNLAWVVALAVVVGRVGRGPRPGDGVGAARPARSPASGSQPWPMRRGAYTSWSAVRSFARADRRSLLRDGLLVMLVASVPLLTLAMRVIATVGVDWARQRYGVVLTPQLPVVEALLLVVHTPVVFGSLTGLLLLEDRDAGLFGPLTATRAGLRTLLAYRLGATAVATSVALAISLPLDGVARSAGLVGVLATAAAAGAASVVPALLVAAVATNRVQGVAVMKMLGLPLYLPLATWVLADGARWAFAPLPTAWVAWASWASSPATAAAAATGSVAVCAAWAVLLTRRFLHHAHTT